MNSITNSTITTNTTNGIYVDVSALPIGTTTSLTHEALNLMSNTGVLMYDPTRSGFITYNGGFSNASMGTQIDKTTLIQGLVSRLDSLAATILGVGLYSSVNTSQFLEFAHNSEDTIMKAITNLNIINSIILEDMSINSIEGSPIAFDNIGDLYPGLMVSEVLDSIRLRERVAMLRSSWASDFGQMMIHERIGLMSPKCIITVNEKLRRLSTIKDYLITGDVTNATIAVTLLAEIQI